MNKDESSILLHHLCHMRIHVAYLILGRMLGSNNSQQFHLQCHRMTLGVQYFAIILT